MWDFFLAHAGPDLAVAERLYGLLSVQSRVFLDSKCLHLGDDWDLNLFHAQQKSRVTVVLVSTNVSRSYYQREKIAAAVAMARSDSESHRVVPLYLPNPQVASSSIPYGLRLKHGITLQDDSQLESAAARLLELLRLLNVESIATETPPIRTQSREQRVNELLTALSANCTKARALQIEDELFHNLREDIDLFLTSSNQYVAPTREAMAVVGGRLLHAGLQDDRIVQLLRKLAADPDQWVRKKARDGLTLAGY